MNIHHILKQNKDRWWALPLILPVVLLPVLSVANTLTQLGDGIVALYYLPLSFLLTLMLFFGLEALPGVVVSLFLRYYPSVGLFETVTGDLDGLYAAGNEVVSEVSGVVSAVNTSAGATVNKGDAVGIIGSNGAGKSTLLKLLTHVTAPTSGDIDLYGRVASMLEVGTGFHPEMTGRENVYLNGAILGMTRAEIDAKMAEIIEFSEVGDFIDTPVKRYSSGMFVKLAFSVAAHLDSEIMIMDEVLAVGDMKFQKKCLTKMRQAARRDGKTVLYVSHNMATIRDLCDRCIVLDKGKVIFDGDVDEGIALYLSTKSQEASFIDYSGVKRDNWFKRDNIRLQSVELLDADNEVLERRKPVTVRYRVHVNEAAADVGLRLEMRDEVGNPLGATCVYGLDLQPGYTTFTARYDLSVLAPGKYGSYFTVITQGEGGAHTVEDWVPGMMFRMVDTLTEGETEWNTTAWGPIELPTAAVVEVQHD